MSLLSHLDWIFSFSDLVLALVWFMENDLLEIGITVSDRPPVFHICAYSSGHVTQLGYVS